jgi:hypothetical protein
MSRFGQLPSSNFCALPVDVRYCNSNLLSQDKPTPTEPETMANRQQRRAAAREEAKLAADIPMAQPDRSKPTAKTLVEIAEEKQRELEAKHPEAFKDKDSSLYKDKPGFVHDEPLSAFEEAILYTFSLSMLHFTLDVLVFNQYRQEIEWSEIFTHTFRMLLPLCLAVYLTHTKTARRFGVLKQMLFFVAATAAGCWLVYSGNKHGYYFVMKRAPPLGTLWVWSVVEMRLMWAVAHLVIVGGYCWWNGFTTF